MRLEKLDKRADIPEGVTVEVSGNKVTVKGPKGELSRVFPYKKLTIVVEGNQVVVGGTQVTKREKTMMGTYASHIRNMVQGVVEPFVYKLRVCSGHFPMNVAIQNNELVVKNFIGEAVPRKLKLKSGADVKLDGQEITVTSIDKEIAGQIAADMEQLMRRPAFDRRIFQDGIYIIHKAGKDITL